MKCARCGDERACQEFEDRARAIKVFVCGPCVNKTVIEWRIRLTEFDFLRGHHDQADPTAPVLPR